MKLINDIEISVSQQFKVKDVIDTRLKSIVGDYNSIQDLEKRLSKINLRANRAYGWRREGISPDAKGKELESDKIYLKHHKFLGYVLAYQSKERKVFSPVAELELK